MSDLPIPLSRIDLYLAVAAGMTGVTMPEKPLSRLEQFLAYIAGDTSVTLPTPLSLTELWLAYVAGVQPKTDEMKLEGACYIGGQKVDVRYFAVAGGMEGVTAPAPQNRTEEYWARIAEIRPIHGVLKYATGTSITLTDVISGIEELQYVYGDTTQQTYSGKNLWGGFSNDFSVSRSGIDFVTHKDGTTDVSSGTTTTVSYSISLSEARSNNLSKTLPSGTYAIAGSVGDISVLVINVTTGALIATSSNGVPATFTLSETTDVFVRAQIEIDTTVPATTIKPMLEAGSATSYEPYVGGIPAPNPDYPQTINVVTGKQTVGVTGKNLCSGTEIGGNGAIVRFYFNGPLSSDTVTISTDLSDSTASNSIALVVDGTNKGALTTVSGSAGEVVSRKIVFTADQMAAINSGTNVYLQLYKSGGHFTNPETPMIEYGATATAYEPYQSQSYNVDLTGKNLFDSTLSNMYITSSASYASQNYVGTNDYFIIKPSTAYTLSLPESMYRIFFVQYDKDKNVLTQKAAGDAASLSFTSESNAVYARMSFSKTDSSAMVPGDYENSVQLEYGSTATTYEPHYNYELCKIGTCQDYIYKSGDNWFVHKDIGSVVLDGGESWQTATIRNNVIYLYINQIFPNSGGAYVTVPSYSDYFIPTTYNTALVQGSTADNCFFFHDTNHCIAFKDSGVSSLSDWETWLGTHNTTVYYPLATPTDTQITDATLISQLNAIDSAVLPNPIAYINVGATSTNLPGPLKISYYGEEE